MTLGALTPVLAVSILVERVLEAIFSALDFAPDLKEYMEKNKQIKPLVSVVLALILGVVFANMLGIRIFGEGLENIDPDADKLLTGLLAGALAPYSHQLIEALFKFQKMLERVKAKEEPAEEPAEGGAG